MKVNRRTAIKTSLLTGLGLLFTGRNIAQECLTTPDIEGPYYIPGSPMKSKISPAGATGTKLFITGTVYAKDCTTPIINAVVDIWHANDAGGYDNVDYRGIIKTDGTGKYAFETILPGKYLNGSQYRPRHLHFKISAPDLNPNLKLTSQIYFSGDSSIPHDPWASDPDASERIIALTADHNNSEHGVADFFINVQPSTGMEQRNQKPLNGISSISPNPVLLSAETTLFLSHHGQADIQIFDINGREVNKLWQSKIVNAGTYKVMLLPLKKNGLRLTAGVYIMRLLLDGNPVDVKRFVVA